MKLYFKRKKKLSEVTQPTEQTQVVICKNCGFKHLIFVPYDIVWEYGYVKCKCGKVIYYKNEILESLYI